MNEQLEIFREELPAEDTRTTLERVRIREFLAEAAASGRMTPQCDSWLSGHSPEFSEELGRRGWIGMTWPRQYGGREAAPAARLAVIEELLAAGAPVAAHWFADRQIGPSMLKHGTEEQRAFFLPPMARGQRYFCIGMSEPDSGSDLGSVRTRAVAVDGGWTVNGSKIWTSHADRSHYMLALVRTGERDGKPADSLTQVIIDMKHQGVSSRPIQTLDGGKHFSEVFLDDVYVPDTRVLGAVGDGWRQVLGELGFERSGPERFLSTFPLLSTAAKTVPAADVTFGSLVARLVVLRAMSARVVQHLGDEQAPAVAAAIVKDLGTRFENDSIDAAREWLVDTSSTMRGLFNEAQTHAPGFTLRGGTSEVMRDIVARALGIS